MSYTRLFLFCFFSFSCETAQSTQRVESRPQVTVPQEEIVIVYID